MRLLLSAFSCMPGRGSEPGVGWGLATILAKRGEVVVLLDTHNRPAFQTWLGRSLPNVKFVFVGLPGRKHQPSRSCVFGYGSYLVWQVKAFGVARQMNRENPFDVVQHATYVNSWVPSFMGHLGIPFIWCAGAREETPRQFYSIMSRRQQRAECVRTLVSRALGRLTLHLTARRASLILTSSPISHWPEGLPLLRKPVGGLSREELQRLGRIPFRKRAPFRVASIGRLEGWKGFGLGILAFRRLLETNPDAEYWVVGEGPERGFLRALAQKAGCETNVRFLGRQSREEVFSILREVDVVLHPSLHEQFGYAVLESMAAGRPVVVLARGRCQLLAEGGGGMAVKASTVPEAVDGIFNALTQLAQDDYRELASARAREAAQAWNWDCFVDHLLPLYESLRPTGFKAVRHPVSAAGA